MDPIDIVPPIVRCISAYLQPKQFANKFTWFGVSKQFGGREGGAIAPSLKKSQTSFLFF
jgi:hypothetical protein